MLIAHLV